MKDLTRIITMLVLAGLASTGCAKKKQPDGDPPPAKVADPSATPKPPAAAAPACSPKAFTHQAPGFCLDLPDGYAAKPEETTPTGSQIRFVRADDYGFSVSWGRWKTAEEAIETYQAPNDGEKLVEEAELPGGGYFRHTTVAAGDGSDYHTVVAFAKGATGFVQCYVETGKADVIAEAIKGCRAIHVD